MAVAQGRVDQGDADLMLRVQADDPNAFSALYDRFSSRAYCTAYGIVRDGASAEDIVQEAFLAVWRCRASFRPASGPPGPWVMGIMRNRAIDALRLHRPHDSRRVDEPHAEAQASAPESVEATVAERNEAARLRSTLARLPAVHRDVIALAYFGDLSHSEIADELSLPLGTVKGRMRLGLNKLRDDIAP